MNTFLGEFEHVLLLTLIHLGEGAHGVDIRRDIEDATGRSVSPGAIHTALDRLERRGYVSSWIGEPTPVRGGKRKRHYRLEPAGSRALQASHHALRQFTSRLAKRFDV